MTSNTSDAEFSVKWQRIAAVSLLVSVALAGALAVVAAKKSADALATTALALALLSFVAQLMIALTQFAVAARQQEEALRIASDTRAALTSIQALSNDLAKVMQGQIDRLLDYALRDLQQEAETPEEVEAADKLVERVREERSAEVTRLPSTRRPVSREAELTAAFARHLRDRGIEPSPPPLGSLSDMVWTDQSGSLYVATVIAPDKP